MQRYLKFVEELPGKILMSRKPPGIKMYEYRLLVYRFLSKKVLDKLQKGGLARTPGAIKSDHKAFWRSQTTYTISKVLRK